MDNGINKRQNSKKALQFLKAADVLYLEAKTLNNFLFVNCVAFQIILNVKLEYSSMWLSYLTFILIISGVIFIWYAEYRIRYKCKVAANIQQLFEEYVFSIDSTYNKSMYNSLKSDISIKSSKFRDKPYNKKINWYNEKYSELPLNEAIYECHESAIKWDRSIRKIYRNVIIILIICNFIIICMMGINEILICTFNRIIFMLPMIKWCGDNIIKLSQEILYLNELLGNFTKYTVEELQYKVNKHRKSCVLVPTIIYKLAKNKLETNDSTTAEMVSDANIY